LRQIWCYGGVAVPEYHPDSVTIVVADKSSSVKPTCRALNVKSLVDIPDRVPIVRWEWVVACHVKKALLTDFGAYALFSSRIYDAGSSFRDTAVLHLVPNNKAVTRTDTILDDIDVRPTSSEASMAYSL
jgi:hypothetical protein